MSDEASNSPLPSPDPAYVPAAPGRLPSGLVLVATPIGNLADFTPRAAACLAQADLVLCEDTRVTAKLFTAWRISTRLGALHEYNERQKIPALIEMLRQGRQIALVSDAGTPLLSDPGFQLVRAVIAAKLPVTAVPGANAALTALTLSGLPPHPFLFLGFPPPREAARLAAFGALQAAEQAGLRATMIWYEAPHRLVAMLADLATVFGGSREAAVGRELTKRFEEVTRGTLSVLSAMWAEMPPRGELTVLIGPAEPGNAGADELDRQLEDALRNLSVKDAAALVAGAANLPKRIVYARAMVLAAARDRAATQDDLTS